MGWNEMDLLDGKMDGCMDRWICVDGWVCGRIDEWVCGWMDGQTDGWVGVWMDG